jgi:integrase
MAQLCLCIARHWAHLPEEQIALIEQWAARLRRPNSGMTEKNRHRLRQFTSGEVVRRVLCLPDHLLSEARKLPVGTTSALMVQNAVAIAILTTAPIRVGNLCSLDREVHFRRAFSVGDRRHHLVFPAREVKNNVDLEFPVPDRVMTLIDHYMCTYQPLIGDGRPSSLLFPGRISDRPKDLSGLRKSVSAVILRETGLHMNAHLFRHLAAYLFLKANPGQYEAVRQLLGHKRIETTINFYASFETDAAMHQFNQVIDGYREVL